MKGFVALWLVWVALIFAGWFVVGWVAWHFISKFW